MQTKLKFIFVQLGKLYPGKYSFILNRENCFHFGPSFTSMLKFVEIVANLPADSTDSLDKEEPATSVEQTKEAFEKTFMTAMTSLANRML